MAPHWTVHFEDKATGAKGFHSETSLDPQYARELAQHEQFAHPDRRYHIEAHNPKLRGIASGVIRGSEALCVAI